MWRRLAGHPELGQQIGVLDAPLGGGEVVGSGACAVRELEEKRFELVEQPFVRILGLGCEQSRRAARKGRKHRRQLRCLSWHGRLLQRR